MQMADNFTRFAETKAVGENLKQRSVHGALFMASMGGLDFVFRLASVAILARLLVPEYFGLFAMVTALTGILEAIKDLGLSAATVQRRDLTHCQVTNLFWLNALAGVLFGLFFCVASSTIASFYHDDRLKEITVAVSLVFVWGGLSVQHEALMCRQLRQGELAVIRLLASVLSTFLAVVLALEEWGYWALVWRDVSRAAMITFLVWLRCPWIPGWPTTRAGTRSLLRFGRDLTFANLMYGVTTNVDRLLVGRLFGATQLGGYRLAHQLIAAPIDQLISPINSVAYSGLSMLQNDATRYRRYYEKATFLIGFCSMPIAAFAVVYAEELTLLLLGQAWIDAVPFFQVFAASAFIRPVMATAGAVLISCGQSGRLITITIVSNVTFLVLIAAGSLWGAIGIALAHVTTPALLLLPTLWFAFARTPITIRGFFRAIRTPVAASVLMLAGLTAFRSLMPGDGGILTICFGFALGMALYLFSFVLLPQGREEIGDLFTNLRAGLPRGWTRARKSNNHRQAEDV